MTQIKGSVIKPTEVMSEKDSIKAFVDGAKQAASAAREMAKETTTKEWEDTATFMDAMRVNAQKLSNMKAMTRIENALAAQIKTGSKLIM